MAYDLAAVREETARELEVEEAELDYIEEVLKEISEGEAEEAENYSETETVEGEQVNSFDCRRPVYEGEYLYYYRDCAGVFGRIRRSRIISIWWIGYCTYPRRKYKVRWR